MNVIHTSESAIYFACGYSNDNAIYLRLGSDAFLITDGRYRLDAKAALQDNQLKIQLVIDNSLSARAVKLITKSNIKKISFDPKEWDHYTILRIQSKANIRWNAKPDLSRKQRIIKSDDEVVLLARATKLGKRAFKQFAAVISEQDFGKSEAELNFLAQATMRDFGKYPLSFEPIVAIGANAAKPHATPTDRRLRKDDLLLFDAGLKYKRYCSDRTRTVRVTNNFRFGYQQEFANKKLQKAYDTVRKAHDRAITKARSGMRANRVDALARDVIEKAGYGKYFVHSTGHGVGLDIHEMPYVSSRSRTKIKDNMVFTIEPGIYIPGEFGIRIEDMVVMQNGRAEVL